MATIYPESLAMPTTPVKGGLTDPTPEYTTPAPKYTQSAAQDASSSTAQSADSSDVAMLSAFKHHPVYPKGNIFQDIRNHLRCHTLFNSNIETLLSQFLTMKDDLEKAHLALAISDRELHKERREKENYKIQFEGLKITLSETQADLREVRTELAESQTKLGLSITQLADVAQRLEIAKNELRAVIRERDELSIRLSDKEKEIKYYISRTTELQLSLEVAIKAEKEANERNSRVTELLLQIERQIVIVERAKEHAERHARDLEERLRLVQAELDGGAGQSLIIELRAQHARLDWDVLRLNDELRHEKNKVHDRDNHIERQDGKIDLLNGRISTFWERIQDYDNIVRTLRHKESRNKFPRMYRRTMFDNTQMPEFSFEDMHILNEEKPAVEEITSTSNEVNNTNTTEEFLATNGSTSHETPTLPVH